MSKHTHSSPEMRLHAFSPLAVAYTSDQLLYEWKIKKHPSDGVEYDPTLKLSQFEKHETYIRELAFSRNETST